MDRSYPIGKFSYAGCASHPERQERIARMESLPSVLEEAARQWDIEGLSRPYRPGGWTRSQVIHHLADSHINFHIRLRLALTEEHPTIKPYNENDWVLLADSSSSTNVQNSLAIVRSVAERCASLFKTLTPAQWERTFFHPEIQKDFTVDFLLALFAWHGDHHAAHVALPYFINP